MDWADDIAYAVHDVEDLYHVGLVPLDRLRTDPAEAERFKARAVPNLLEEVPRYNDLGEDQLTMVMREAFDEAVRSATTLEPFRGTRRQRAGLRTYTATRVNTYVNAVKLVLDKGPGKQVEKAEPAQDQVNLLKQLTRVYVSDNLALEIQQYGRRKAVQDLFAIYTKAMTAGKDMGIFPPGYREELDATNHGDERIRIVAELIAFMSEPQLLKPIRD